MENRQLADNGRIAYFDNAKFILILLVVIGHFAESIVEISDLALSTKIFIYTFHMPAFIFISGLFFNPDSKNNKSRIIFFLSIFVLMNIFNMIKNLCFTGTVSLNITIISAVPWFMFALSVWIVLSVLLKGLNTGYILGLFVVLALIIGYDATVGDKFCISRIIYFYPFFLLGTMIKRETVIRLTDSKAVKIASAVLILIVLYLSFFKADALSVITPMLSGRNPYYTLGDNEIYGCLLRAAMYIIQTLMTFAVLALVPKRKMFISDLGQRTMAVYCLHIIFIGTVNVFVTERLLVLIPIAIALTFILSAKVVYEPFRRLEKFIRSNGK